MNCVTRFVCYSAGDTLLTDVCYIKSHDGDGRGMGEELVLYCCFLPVYGVVVGLSYGHVHCLLFTVTDVISHSLSVHPSLFDSVESCPQVELTLINTSAHLVLWYNGTGSCIPLPIRVLFV